MPDAAWRVTGRVQGVGFRWWTRTQALRMGVSGTVRNTPQGAVEVQARGSAEALDAFRERLHSGPPGAQVERVEDIPIIPGNQEGFRIIR